MNFLEEKPQNIPDALEAGKLKIAVYGIGKMGLPLALAFADKNAVVIGVDVNEELVQKINSKHDVLPFEPGVKGLLEKHVGKNFAATADFKKAKADVHIILVPTLLNEVNGKIIPDLSLVVNAAGKIGKLLEKGNAVVVECTMPPGSTESLIPVLENESGLKCGKDFGLAHAPERTMSGTAIRDITERYPKILGASDGKTLAVLKELYGQINSKGVIAISNIRTAEAVKVFEGVYRDVNIALANELWEYSDSHGIDAMEAFSAANSQPYCHIHSPGCGVGGHCIPYYPHFIMGEKTFLVKAARKTNDSMPAKTVELAEDELRKAGKGLSGAKILLLGLSFRAGVKEFRKTPSKPMIELLKKKGAFVRAFDPLCDAADSKELDADEFKLDFEGADCVIIATNDPSFKKLDWKDALRKMRTRIVVDGRQVLDPDAIRKENAVYRGIGRL
ncbi:MAG TPA: nucleotide sugar dehydrogenase [Candidatus Norongarragalinales archaeon]|nr:nucleotide sugar dehydrogenase [Candidatus Norongarragalinales archaeon]